MKKYINLMIQFGLYMFLYLSSELLINLLAENIVKVQNVVYLYGAGAIFAGLGFLSLGIVNKVNNSKFLRNTMLITGLISIISLWLISFIKVMYVFIIFTLIFTFMLGYIGGIFLYHISAKVKEKELMPVIIAIPYAGAFLTQMIIRRIINNNLFVNDVILSCIILLVTSFLLRNLKEQLETENTSDYKIEPYGMKKYLISILIISGILSFLVGLGDGIVTELHAGQQLDVSGFTRFFAIPGIFVAMFFAWWQRGKFLPISTLCAMIMLILSVLLLDKPENFNFSMALIYFFSAFMTIYSIVPFLQIASNTKSPMLWSSAGRGIKYVATGVASIISGFAFVNISLYVIGTVYVVFLIILLILFFITGKLQMQKEPNLREKQEEMFFKAREKFILTSRENEILKNLYLGKTNKEIAEELYITEATVKFHVGKLFKKLNISDRNQVISVFKNENLI